MFEWQTNTMLTNQWAMNIQTTSASSFETSRLQQKKKCGKRITHTFGLIMLLLWVLLLQNQWRQPSASRPKPTSYKSEKINVHTENEHEHCNLLDYTYAYAQIYLFGKSSCESIWSMSYAMLMEQMKDISTSELIIVIGWRQSLNSSAIEMPWTNAVWHRYRIKIWRKREKKLFHNHHFCPWCVFPLCNRTPIFRLVLFCHPTSDCVSNCT